MPYLVFTQSDEGSIDFEKLQRHALQFFDSRVDVLESGSREVHVGLRCPLRGMDLGLQVHVRKRKFVERRIILDAEARGQVSGMGELAEACDYVWEVEPQQDSKGALWFCAILASVGLGPIMPPDCSTLLGVRAVRERFKAEEGYRDKRCVQSGVTPKSDS